MKSMSYKDPRRPFLERAEILKEHLGRPRGEDDLLAALEADRVMTGMFHHLDLHRFRSGLLRAILAIKEIGYPQAASVRCLSCSTFSGGRSMKDMIIGVDLAKRIFQVHGATPSGEVVYRKKLSREQFRAFLTSLPASLVVFEACGSTS